MGFIDDIINVFGDGHGAAGLRAPVKFAMITIIGLVLGWWFAVKLGWTAIEVPFFGDWQVGTVGMILIFAFCGGRYVERSKYLGWFRRVGGRIGADGIWSICGDSSVSGAVDADRFCLTVVGWLLSYIWFNVPPARFMMGDTGSFAIGAGLGVVAMMTNAFFLLPIIGGLFVVEAGSSLIQIFWKKAFHKKLFISGASTSSFGSAGLGRSENCL